MENWKERLYEFLYKEADPFDINAIQEKRLEGFISRELSKEREEGIQTILDKMSQYVERGGQEFYLDFYIKSTLEERYYCSCYTDGDKKLTPEYEEKTLLESLIKTKEHLSNLLKTKEDEK